MAERATLSLGSQTDIAGLLEDGAQLTDRGDYLVIESPHNPTYYWGNFLQVLVPTASRTPAQWLRVFESELPNAAHRALAFIDAPDAAAWQAVGLKVDGEETLATSEPPGTGAQPLGYVARPLGVDGDWAALHDLRMRENERTTRHPALEERDYLNARVRSWRANVEAGRAAWFGGFDAAGTLQAALGIRLLRAPIGEPILLARYQSVTTDAEHRRRGLCSHLLGLAGGWAAERGAQRWVICTETTNAAGRVYRSAGFQPVAVAYGAERQPERA